MTPADDILEGVDAIAAFMGWDTTKVYRARRERWTTPIRKQQGMGLYALKSELNNWLLAPESLIH